MDNNDMDNNDKLYYNDDIFTACQQKRYQHSDKTKLFLGLKIRQFIHDLALISRGRAVADLISYRYLLSFTNKYCLNSEQQHENKMSVHYIVQFNKSN